MFGCYIKNKKKLRNGGGVNCEEEMKGKKWDGWGGMYVCGGGEEKRKVGGTWVVGKKKKRKKKWGVGYRCMVGKKGEWKKKEEKKNWKGKN